MSSFIELYLGEEKSKYLQSEVEKVLKNSSQKIYHEKTEALKKLKEFKNYKLIQNQRYVELKSTKDLGSEQKEIEHLLKTFIPWKKGPSKLMIY